MSSRTLHSQANNPTPLTLSKQLGSPSIQAPMSQFGDARSAPPSASSILWLEAAPAHPIVWREPFAIKKCPKRMKKTYCLDTNVVIHDPRAIFSFDDNVVVLTEYVLMELDNLKQGNEERTHSARDASRILREVTEGLSEKIIAEQKERLGESKLKRLPEIPIPGTKGGTLVLLMDDPENRVKGPNPDDQILGLLYRNRGDGTFEDVTQKVGLDKVFMVMGANFGDVDNDGFLDFYLGAGQPSYTSPLPHVLLRNNEGKSFVDITESSGTGELHKGHGIAFAEARLPGDRQRNSDRQAVSPF